MCQSIWDRRATFPGFAEIDANLKALESAARQLSPSVRDEIVSALQALGGTEAIYSAGSPLSQPQKPPPAGQTAANPLMVPTAPDKTLGKRRGESTPTRIEDVSPDQRASIADYVRECWTTDAGSLDIDKNRVLLKVTTDASGLTSKAEVAGDDVSRLSDPRFRAFAQRAIRAVTDPHCADLPLPNDILGRVDVLTFWFSP
jgi:hypothetical protein